MAGTNDPRSAAAAPDEPANTWQIVEREIVASLARVDERAFAGVLAAFAEPARRWFLSGQGRSGLVAQMAAMRFMHLGFTTHVIGEATAPAVRGGDGLLLVSGSGQTPLSQRFAEIAKAEGAEVVLITCKAESAIARLADIVLTVPGTATRQFGGSLFEQCALILLDGIAFSLAERQADAHTAMWRRHTNMQ